MENIKRWKTRDPIPPEVEEALAGFHPILRQILFNRGLLDFRQADEFLEATRPQDSDPFSMLGMQEAVDRLAFAVNRGERIAVYGDYDADGVSATALMMQTFKALKANVRHYIPNRFDEGYGLNTEALDELAADGVQVVLTVDCGIRALAEADHARKLGLDLIITDHHSVGPELPPAYALVNPRQPGDPYPEKNLAGVGVAFKTAGALLERVGGGDFAPDSLLDLVALGTVADLVPLTGENRYLVRAGLEKLSSPQRQGHFSLMQVAGVRPAQVSSMNIGFSLGPRLNAAGRLDSALAALELLITDDLMRAGQLAQQLDNQNRERQRITRQMQELAEQIAIPEGTLPFLIFAHHPEFNPGVVGLTASRLVERYYRPAIVAERGDTHTRGSCRSIPEFHITEALDQCADLLSHFGGHAAAAGFTLPNEHLPEFIERLQSQASEQLASEDLRPLLEADVEVPLSDLTPELLRELDRLQPTGQGNPEPTFISRNVRVENARTVGRDQSHLKMTVSEGKRPFLDAIAFRQGHWQEDMPPRVDLLYNFELNVYQGRKSLQLNVRDIRLPEPS